MTRRPRKSIAQTGLTDHELRLLRYLDQRGPTHRRRIVADLAEPTDVHRLKCKRERAAPQIMGAWSKRLAADGLVRKVESRFRWTDRRGECRVSYHYEHHEITPDGRQLLRTVPHPNPTR